MKGRIEPAVAGVKLGVRVAPGGARLDHVPDADAAGDSVVDVGEDAARNASEQGRAERRALLGLGQLEGKKWDVVIDNSGYFPRHVDASAKLLAANADRYIYISSISVYADYPPAGGVTIQLTTSDENIIAVSAFVTILPGEFSANALVTGVRPGTAIVTATNPDFATDSTPVSTAVQLDIVQGSATFSAGLASIITGCTAWPCPPARAARNSV